MPRIGSEGSSSAFRGHVLNLYPVAPHESGEGLPYAPEDCPNPGDKWGWKVGSRLSNTGDYRDRTVFPPSRLCQNGSKIVFRSRVALKAYIRDTFPGVDADAIANSFSWRIPSVESRKGTFRHAVGTAEAPDSDDRLIVARCKARNEYCSTLARLEGSSPEVMDCDICCSEPHFCRICCCILCCKPINEACGTYEYIRCSAKIGGSTCGHICHMECALQSHMAGAVGESCSRLNAEYYCRRCDSKTDLVVHFADILQSCESMVIPQDCLEKTLDVGIRALQGSENGSARELLQRIQTFKSKASSSLSTASHSPNVGSKVKIEFDSPQTVDSLGQLSECHGTKQGDPDPVTETDEAPNEDGSMDVDPVEADNEDSSDDAGDEQSSAQSENIPRLVKGDATFNGLRFHSRQEHSRYIANRHRAIIPDKGFSQDNMQNPLVRDAIESRGWEEFAKHPDEDSAWELVREFYANAGYDGTSASRVRRCRVEYSADVLNNLFNVRATPKGHDLLSPVKNKDTGPKLRKVVLESLCKHSGPQWADATKTNRIRCCQMDAPNFEWWRFHRSKLNPSSHLDSSNAEHLYPVYCIMKGLPLNIGEIIEADIFHRAINPKVNLGHPHLILKLCRAAGVQTEEFNMDFKIGPPIKFRQTSGPASPSARMIQIDDPELSTSESPQSSEKATPQRSGPSRKRKSIPATESQYPQPSEQGTPQRSTPSRKRKSIRATESESPQQATPQRSGPSRKRKSMPATDGDEDPSSISLWDIHREMREMNSRLDTLTSRIDSNGHSIDGLQSRVELFLNRAAEHLGIQFPPPSGTGSASGSDC